MKLFSMWCVATPIELAVILAAFYGLRRSEVVGLKWDAIDFEKKTFTVKHTVTQVTVDGKEVTIPERPNQDEIQLSHAAAGPRLLRNYCTGSDRSSWSIRRCVERPIARSTWIISMSMRWGSL